MKKTVSLLLSTSMLCSLAVTVSAATSNNADFETTQTKFGKSTTYAGFKNTTADYQDSIKPSWVEGGGKDGSTGLQITYKSASWYAGEIFFAAPLVWGNSEEAQFLNLDYKGSGSVKISLSTGNEADGTLTAGTRYSYKLTAETDGEWRTISIPLSEFVNDNESVDITEIGCVTFQAGENANLNNNSDETKAMSADELEAVAKKGTIVLDNMELSDEARIMVDTQETPSPTTIPGTEPYMADFESAEAKFGNSTVYSGFKNATSDYQDYIKPTWVAGDGKDNSTGLQIAYKSATWYAGEIFFPTPAVWEDAENVEYIRFDYKGKGSIKISLSTGNAEENTLTKGTRYSYKLNADTNDEWQTITIPLSEFVNGNESVDITKIGCITFQAGVSANLNNNAEATKAMTAAELEEKAKTGTVIFDNMTITNSSGASASVKLFQNEKELTVFGVADDGEMSIKATLSGCELNEGITAVAAIYENNRLCNVKRNVDPINDLGEVTINIDVKDASDKTMKVFILESFDNIKPIVQVKNF